ncbi:hypothetical protein NLG97_g8878 [Lecanicillium saksenae]|uniref:Uncharacterized protein n=1 Tax=Lecanicillium saksenae TaxID=468837 RepID=A0ACC1QJ17_9HYPO|nr:hypothetical protein NLG97_g8878 [Lecanicillium saksenae]
MSDQVATHPGRPEEPQCYNCGGMGHWAVACPEPTRETPAGLAAWRNASAARQGNGRAQQNDGRKSKGPIITKYGPPPPPAGYGAHYPPPPGYPPQHPQYSAPPPQPSYPPQYHYPHGHGQPPPPPPSHGQHHYPPPPYPAPSDSYHGQQPRPPYNGAPQGYGTAPGTPQGYGGYPYQGQDNQQFVPPRPAYSGSYTQGPSSSNQKRHNQRPQAPHRNSASSPPRPQAAQAASSPPKPATPSLPAPMAHGLPPKPPKSVHDIDHGRDQRNNKRKHDHQNRPKDIKEHHPGRNHGSPKAMPAVHANHTHNQAGTQHQNGAQNRHGKQGGHRRRSSAGNHGPNQPRMQRQQSKDSLNHQGPGAQRSPPPNPKGRRRSSNGEQHRGQASQNSTVAKPNRDSHTPKAAETTPTLIKNIPSLPPKPATVVEAHIPKAF